MTRKRGTGHAPFCSGGHALDVDCATAYDLAQAKRDKDEAAAQLDAPAANESVHSLLMTLAEAKPKTEAEKRAGVALVYVNVAAVAALVREQIELLRAARAAVETPASIWYAHADDGRVFLIGAKDKDDARERFIEATKGQPLYIGTDLRPGGGLGVTTFWPPETTPGGA